jgi:hypothetical protein
VTRPNPDTDPAHDPENDMTQLIERADRAGCGADPADPLTRAFIAGFLSGEHVGFGRGYESGCRPGAPSSAPAYLAAKRAEWEGQQS